MTASRAVRIVRYLTPIAMLLPQFAFAAPQSFGDLADTLVYILNTATATAITLVFVFYFYGVATDLTKVSSGEGSEKRKEYFFWGIIGLFVMISVGGIVAMLENSLFSSSSSMTGGSIPIGLGN